MDNQSSENHKTQKEAHAKTPKKRGRKLAMAISRPPLPPHNCTNIQPTGEECTALQLPQPSQVTHDEPGTSNVNIDVGKPQEVPGFEDFSSEPPDQLLRRSTRVSGTGSTPPPKRRKVVHPHKTKVDQQVGCLVELIKKNHSELMKVVGEKDNKTEKKNNVDQDIGGSAADADEQVNETEKDYTTGEASHSDTKILNADEHDVDTLQHNIEHTTSMFSVDTSTEVENNVQPLCLISHVEQNESAFWLSDSQLPTQLPVKKSSLPPDTETPAPRHRMPARILRSPYLTDFGSNDKGKAKIDDDVLPLYPFEGCGILEQLPLGKFTEESATALSDSLFRRNTWKGKLRTVVLRRLLPLQQSDAARQSYCCSRPASPSLAAQD
uniref:Uncharacterized protein n=1 Tax=Solanum lycopersicum TaxID=4081 RepID=A0A3Q7JUA6_SOLLC